MFKKIAILAFMMPILMGASGETFESYANRRVESATEQGHQYVNLVVSSKFFNEAIEYAMKCIANGFYAEVNKVNGTDMLSVNWGRDGRIKQEKIRIFVDNYTEMLIAQYDACPEAFYVLGMMHSTKYTGNFYHGCGADFIEKVRENAHNLEFKDFDYTNMQISISLALYAKGFRLNKINAKDEFVLFELVKMEDKKVYNRVPF